MDITSFLIGKEVGGGSAPTPTYQNKEITITQNGEQTITADSGYDALSSVEITTNVPQPSGKITITENGTDIDVSSYATADVNVSGTTPTATNYNELTTYSTTVVNNFLNYLNTTAIENRVVYTDQSVNLYTPDIDCKNYIIRYRDGKYSVVWLNGNGVKIDSSKFNRYMLTLGSYVNSKYNNNNDKIEIKSNFDWRISADDTNFKGYFSNQIFNTPEDAINAIINNQITYSSASGNYFGYDNNTSISGYIFPYSNCFFIQETTGNVVQSKIISYSETFTVIS